MHYEVLCWASLGGGIGSRAFPDLEAAEREAERLRAGGHHPRHIIEVSSGGARVTVRAWPKPEGAGERPPQE